MTRLIHTSVVLEAGPDDVSLDVRDGHLFIILGDALSICLDEADKDTIDRLALVTAEASLVKRSRDLWEVA